MGAAEQLKVLDSENNKGKTLREKVKNTHTEELFIGICAPIGSRKEYVISQLEKTLRDEYDYEIKIIKLSKFIDNYQINGLITIPEKTVEFSKLMHKIKQGDEIRNKYKNNSVLVELAIQQIFNERTSAIAKTPNELPLDEEYVSRRTCYIIDSIKNKEELLLLRAIYGELFYLISVFSPLQEREDNLSSKNLSPNEIKEIIATDEYENNSFGQNVRNTFVDGDFFLRVSEKNHNLLQEKIKRFLHLIFETDIITPHPHENAMYAAKSAASNSSCLSRQVGASITDSNGGVISKGWNDVPKYGGNLYQEGDKIDKRCKHNGYCSNDRQKDFMVDSIVESLKSDETLNTIFKDNTGVINNILVKNFSMKLRDSKIKDLIEFSRAVHAEMHAIISGSQLSGSKMIGGKLFCTTYPCHNCARHIIVAGIKEVYFIEPYVKSLCIELHNDAITEDENEDDKVKIIIYDGVAPRKYLTFFTNFVERKDKSGNLATVDLKEAQPKMSKTLQALFSLERQAIHSLAECGIINS